MQIGLGSNRKDYILFVAKINLNNSTNLYLQKDQIMKAIRFPKGTAYPILSLLHIKIEPKLNWQIESISL